MIMTGDEKGRRDKGMSIDLDLHSPYVLPAALNGSRESFHSMSRSIRNDHDPYRPVTFAKDSDSTRGGSVRG